MPASYDCPYCSKTYPAKYALEEHIYGLHTNQRPFICKQCGATFPYRSSLHNHSRIHKEGRPFKCKICGISYRWKNSLRFHMKSGKCNPVTTTTFQCPYCEILLPSQKDLDNHAPNCLNEIIAKQQELPLEAISKKRLRFEEATSSSSSAAIEKEFYPESLGLLEDDDESSRTTISFGAQDAKGDFVSSSSNHLGSAINVEQLLSDSADESLVQFDSADEFDEDTVVASSQLTPRHGQFRIQISGNNEMLDEEETSYFDPAAMLNELVNLRGDLCEVRKDISDLQEGVFKKLNRLQQSMDEIRKAIIK